MAEIFKSSMNVKPRLRTTHCPRQWQQHEKGQGLMKADVFKYLKYFILGLRERWSQRAFVSKAMQMGSMRPRTKSQDLQLGVEGIFPLM